MASIALTVCLFTRPGTVAHLKTRFWEMSLQRHHGFKVLPKSASSRMFWVCLLSKRHCWWMIIFRCCWIIWILCLITYWRLSAWLESECKPDHKFIKFGDCSINCETAQIPKGCVSEYAVPLNASQGLKPHVNHEAIAICIHMCHSVKTWLVFPYWGMVINPMIWIPNNIYIRITIVMKWSSIHIRFTIYTGWWFQTWFLLSISYMGCHPSHWRTHIFQDG